MTDFDLRTLRSKLPPWAILLIGLFALNALAPAPARTKKSESTGEVGLSQKVDGVQEGGSGNSPVETAPPPTLELVVLPGSASRIPRSAAPADLPPPQRLNEAIRGRAPPPGVLA